MTSYLLISSNKVLLEEKTLEICQEKHIDPFDLTVFDLTTIEAKTTPKRSWGIDDVKALQKKICLKPMRGEWKAIILKDADLLTIEAQNALLKVLEEPPQNTLFILCAHSQESFLPTVRSRCTILTVGETQSLAREERNKILDELELLMQANISERLKKAESISKSKEEALSWIKSALLAVHETLTEESIMHDASLLRSLHEHYKVINNTNTNVRLATEHLMLTLS